jgi:dGTPase
MEDCSAMPEDWRARVEAAGGSRKARARVVADYIAGMTDRFAIREHRRVYNAEELT